MKMPTEKTIKQIRKIMQADQLTRDQVDELVRLGNLGGTLPDPDGEVDGKPFWNRKTFQQWASSEALHYRAGAATRLQQPMRGADVVRGERAAVRPSSWNEDARSFECVATTENRVAVIDWQTGDTIDEVLRADGVRIENGESVGLHIDHERSVASMIGTADHWRREGTAWHCRGRIATTPAGDAAAALIRDGHARAVSIGYRILEYTVLMPGDPGNEDGDRPLRVVTDWVLDELSVVWKGADPGAMIRGERNGRVMSAVPAIHSRNSVTHRPTVGELASGVMLSRGVSAPSRLRAAIDNRNGNLVRVEPSSSLERDAERGEVYSRMRPVEILRRVGELDGIRFASWDIVTVLNQLRTFSQRAGASTSNLFAFFENVVATFLMVGWDAAGDSTDGWVEETDNLTYQHQPRSRVVMGELSLHAAGGVAEDIQVEATSEDTQVARYSRKWTVDEQDIINANGVGGSLFDDLVPRMMGGAARALRPNLVYSLLARNPTMADGVALFDAVHGNLKTTAALADATLAAAQQAVSAQRELGIALNLRGDYLVVPSTLERPAGKLLRDVDLSGDRDTARPTLRVESRLENGIIDPLTGAAHAGSASTWYLASAAPGHGVGVQYLAGRNRLPRISVWFLDRGDFGVAFGVDHSIGCTAIGHRGLVRNEA